jgi:hypothetical protein
MAVMDAAAEDGRAAWMLVENPEAEVRFASSVPCTAADSQVKSDFPV